MRGFFTWGMSHRWAAFLDMGSGQLGLQVPTLRTVLQTVAQGSPAQHQHVCPKAPPLQNARPACPLPEPGRFFTFKEALE